MLCSSSRSVYFLSKSTEKGYIGLAPAQLRASWAFILELFATDSLFWGLLVLQVLPPHEKCISRVPITINVQNLCIQQCYCASMQKTVKISRFMSRDHQK